MYDFQNKFKFNIISNHKRCFFKAVDIIQIYVGEMTQLKINVKGRSQMKFHHELLLIVRSLLS